MIRSICIGLHGSKPAIKQALLDFALGKLRGKGVSYIEIYHATSRPAL